jgi:hypothetical protein
MKNLNPKNESVIINIGNAAFTTKEKLIDTLFHPINGKTADGFYKKRARGILFSRPSGEPWFFLVANKWGERFFVSCGQVNGRTVYMHSMSERDEQAVGIDGLRYSQKGELAGAIWNSLS